MQKLTRRNVITTLTASSIILCPAVLNAHDDEDFSWGPSIDTSKPSGQDRLVLLKGRSEPVDISDTLPLDRLQLLAFLRTIKIILAPGWCSMLLFLRRTSSQIEAAKKNDRTGKVKDPRYFVVNLICPHKGFAIGITSMENRPFACTKEGDRHHSIFDSSGFGVHGKSSGEYMSVPEYTLDIETDNTKAVLTLA